MLDIHDYKRNAFRLRKEAEEARSRQTLRKLRAAIVEDQPKGIHHYAALRNLKRNELNNKHEVNNERSER